MTQSPNDQKLSIFISYSRRQSKAADELVKELEIRDFKVTIDRRDLPFGEEWQAELRHFIVNSDSVIWLVSPESTSSPWVNWELGEVQRANKRLIPILVEPTNPEFLPPALGKIHIFPVNGIYSNSLHITDLERILETDSSWIKEHSRLSDRAREWVATGQGQDRLLRGAALSAAGAWLKKQPRAAPAPSMETLALLAASERAAKWRQRYWIVSAGIVALGASVLALIAFIQRENAISQRDAALKTQSLFLADLSGQQVSGLNADATTAVLLALESLPDRSLGPGGAVLSERPYIPEGEFYLNQALKLNREIALLSGHADKITDGALSPNGKFLATSSWDGTVFIWDLNTRKELARAIGHNGRVLSVAFNLDGSRLTTGGADQTARIWDAANGRELMQFRGHLGDVWCSRFSADGMQLVTASEDETVRIWDVRNGEERGRLKGHEGRVLSAAFSPDNQKIVTSSSDQTARIWDVRSARQLMQLDHDGWVHSASFSPDGQIILTASSDKTARTWNAASGKEILRFVHASRVLSASFSPDGKRMVSGSSDGLARIWNLETGDAIETLHGHVGAITSAAFGLDTARIATTSEDATARIWNAELGKKIVELSGGTGGVSGAVFSPDGKTVLASFMANIAVIWDRVTGKQIKTFVAHSESVNSARFNQDASLIVTASEDKTARVWNSITGEELLRLDHANAVANAAFSPDGLKIVTFSEDHTARIWNLGSGKLLIELKGYELPVGASGPNAGWLAAEKNSNRIRIWDLATGKTVAHIDGITDVMSFSMNADRTKLITGLQDRTARIWDVATGNQLNKLEGHQGEVLKAVFSSDGTRIASISSDLTARIWDTASGKELSRLDGLREGLMDISFSPDDEQVVIGVGFRAILWTIPERSTKRTAQAKRELVRCLTAPQRRRFFLSPEPPRWCITGADFASEIDPTKWKGLWPYDTEAWRAWLVAKDRGNSPLPPQ